MSDRSLEVTLQLVCEAVAEIAVYGWQCWQKMTRLVLGEWEEEEPEEEAKVQAVAVPNGFQAVAIPIGLGRGINDPLEARLARLENMVASLIVASRAAFALQEDMLTDGFRRVAANTATQIDTIDLMSQRIDLLEMRMDAIAPLPGFPPPGFD